MRNEIGVAVVWRGLVGLLRPSLDVAAPRLPPQAERNVGREQIAQLVRQLPLNHVANPLCVAGYMLIYWDLRPHELIIVWAVYSQVANGFGAFLGYLFRHQPSRWTDRHWRNWFTLFSIADALTWASAVWLFFIEASPLHTLFLGGTMLGIAAGAQLAYLSLLRAAIILTAITMLALSARLFIADSFIYYILSGLVLVYLGLVVEIARRSNLMLLSAWRLRYAVEDRQAQLRHSNERLTDLYQNAPTPYVSLDPANGTLRRFNTAFNRMTGYDDDDLGRLRFDDILIPPADSNPDDANIFARLSSGGSVPLTEMQVRRKDGTLCWTSLSAIPRMHEDGSPAELRVTLSDITDQKNDQERLRAAMELAEHANQAKTLFLSSMSHELRTPMNAILGFAQLLSRDLDSDRFRTQREYTDHIISSGNHLLELISHVLDLSRIEEGRLSLDIQDIDAAIVIHECMELATPLAERRKILLTNNVDDRWLPEVAADGTRLRQVLLILLSNAVKYNRPNGQVTLDAMVRADRMLRISVTDSGIGIAADQQASVFEPFVRLKMAREIDGTGIGLSISKHLIDLMGGRIDLTSVPGQGTKFWIDIPLATERHMSDGMAGVEAN